MKRQAGLQSVWRAAPTPVLLSIEAVSMLTLHAKSAATGTPAGEGSDAVHLLCSFVF